MFDLSFPALSVPFPAGRVPVTPHVTFDPTLPFALTLADRNPAAAMSGEAHPRIIGCFTTLAEAMRGAIKMAEELEPDAAPRMLAILDRDERLVLAGAAANGAVAWCAPVMFIQARLEDLDRDEPLCSGFEFSLREGDAAHVLWIHDDESGDVEQVIGFVLRLAEAFDLKGLWGFTYALTCSRPRLDAFGGGAHVIDLGARKSIGWTSTQEWLAAALRGEDFDA